MITKKCVEYTIIKNNKQSVIIDTDIYVIHLREECVVLFLN